MGDTITREGWLPTPTQEIVEGDGVRWNSRIRSRRPHPRFQYWGLVEEIEPGTEGTIILTIKTIEGRSTVVAEAEASVFQVFHRGEQVF